MQFSCAYCESPEHSYLSCPALFEDCKVDERGLIIITPKRSNYNQKLINSTNTYLRIALQNDKKFQSDKSCHFCCIGSIKFIQKNGSIVPPESEMMESFSKELTKKTYVSHTHTTNEHKCVICGKNGHPTWSCFKSQQQEEQPPPQSISTTSTSSMDPALMGFNSSGCHYNYYHISQVPQQQQQYYYPPSVSTPTSSSQDDQILYEAAMMILRKRQHIIV